MVVDAEAAQPGHGQPVGKASANASAYGPKRSRGCAGRYARHQAAENPSRGGESVPELEQLQGAPRRSSSGW